MTGTALKNKITQALDKVTATDAVVYYRVSAIISGDELLGVDTEAVFTDYKMTPQPAVIVTPGSPIVGKPNALSTPRKNTSQLELIITPDSVEESILLDKNVTIVLKRGPNLSEESEYAVSAVVPYYYDGSAVALKVSLTSKVTSP